MAHMYIRDPSSQAVVATTLDDGTFEIPAGLGLTSILLGFQGPYVDVCSYKVGATTGMACGNFTPTYGVVQGPNAVTINPVYKARLVAQANCFNSINQMRNWVRKTNPTDNTFDDGAPYRARPNRGSGCSAVFAGNEVRFDAAAMQVGAGTPCPNMAWAAVIWHEMGHWMNQNYGNARPGATALDEGIADVWSMYLLDFEITGNGTSGARSGLNTDEFCGDCAEGCWGEVHADGQPLMGALWKVRRNLETTHGEVLGAEIADALFLGWLNATNIPRIEPSTILYQWLILDDDDGIVSNGTPNFDDINNAFKEQGQMGTLPFPGAVFPVPVIDCP